MKGNLNNLIPAKKGNKLACKPDFLKCSEKLTLNLTRTQKDLIEAEAARRGMTKKAYLMRCVELCRTVQL